MKAKTFLFCDALFLLGILLFLSGVYLLFGLESTLIVSGVSIIAVSLMLYANVRANNDP